MGFDAKILADSVSPAGVRLTSFEVSFPRPFLAEWNTHRVFSRNSASSRAIPVEKMIKRVLEDPYIPTSWGKNQKGMQANVEVSSEDGERAKRDWLVARDNAVVQAWRMIEIGIHKQIVNRLLEPWLWQTVIVTATEWSNFFHLRNNSMAQPEIQIIARMMQQLYESHEPDPLDYGEWHLPLIYPADYESAFEQGVAQMAGNSVALQEQMVKVSVGRCARVSYLTHDGKRDLRADIELHDSLIKNGHLSPAEHVARPVHGIDEKNCWFGNFRGFVQYRKTIPFESDILGAHE